MSVFSKLIVALSVLVMFTSGCKKIDNDISTSTPQSGTITIINTSWARAYCSLSSKDGIFTSDDSATFIAPIGEAKFMAYYMIPGYHGNMDTVYWSNDHMKGVDSLGYVNILQSKDTKIFIRSEQMP